MRSRRMSSIVVAAALVMAACGGGEAADTTQEAVTTMAPPTTTSAPVAGDGCDMPLAESGEYEGFQIGTVDQPYWVVVPASYDEVVPAPLYLHLASGSGDHDGSLAGWLPYLDDLNGVMVMVNTQGAIRGEPDVMLTLIDQMSSEFCIDQSRIHVMGTSSSGDEAERLACEAPDRIASFVTGISGNVPSARCSPESPVPLLTFTGDVDRSSTKRLLERWTSVNGCEPELVVEDLGSGVFRKTYQSCVADVLFYDIESMGHAWPLHEAKGPGAAYVAEYEEVDYLDEAMKFFADHPLS